MIVLPRQARDKHRKYYNRDTVFPQYLNDQGLTDPSLNGVRLRLTSGAFCCVISFNYWNFFG